MKEYHAFCLWREHKELRELIYKSFKVVESKKYDLAPEVRAKKVRDIYEIFIVGEDERIWSKHPIEIIVVEVDAEYGIRTTGGTKNTRFVNTEVFDFKTNSRKKLGINFRYIHATDHVLESNKVFKSFELPQYITDFTMVNLREARAVKWHVNPFKLGLKAYENTENYDFLKITECPHYNFLQGQKDEYLKYVKKIDTVHSDADRYRKLIEKFDYKKYNSSEKKDLIQVSYIDEKPVIIDGLHRASILIYNYQQLDDIVVRVRINDNHQYRNKK
tara:strand:+ start:240 stop:1061 length:822 start_codon:yes stop_codon:yes gene_type:complete